MEPIDISAYLASDQDAFIKPIVVLYPGRGAPQPSAADLPGLPNIKVVTVPLGHFKYLRPRHLAWTHWPVAFDLVADVDAARIDADQQLNTPSALVRETLLTQSHFIVDLRFVHRDDHLGFARAFSRCLAVRNSLKLTNPILLRYPHQKSFVDVAEEQIMDNAAGSLRLEHNYACNFNVIGSAVFAKHFDQGFDQFSSTDWRWRDQTSIAAHARRKWDETSSSILDTPIALQLLFALRQASIEDAAQNFANFAKFDDGSKFSAGALLVDNEWKGSGKYPSFTGGGRSFVFLLAAFWGLGLLDVNIPEKSMQLTQSAHAFLNSLHRTNDDPDSLLRFLHPVTQTIPASSIDRVDEWMIRFFRKMKQKAA
jgi:hypothetical protein